MRIPWFIRVYPRVGAIFPSIQEIQMHVLQDFDITEALDPSGEIMGETVWESTWGFPQPWGYP